MTFEEEQVEDIQQVKEPSPQERKWNEINQQMADLEQELDETAKDFTAPIEHHQAADSL